MDLEAAVSTHVAWRMKLRAAITKKEQMDAAAIGSADRCDLGAWLAGEGKATAGRAPEYAALVQAHQAFHREAANVAAAVNARDYRHAEAMLGNGTAYAKASLEVTKAILGLQNRAS